MYGGVGDDALIGDGNDILAGGDGGGRIGCAEGEDWVSYRNSAVGVYVSLEDGVGRNGDAAGDKLSSIENIGGSLKDDELCCDRQDNKIRSLYGGDGNDTLYGGVGLDRMHGGDGDDTLNCGGADTFVFEAGHGNDRIEDFGDGDLIDLEAFANGSGVNDFTMTVDGGVLTINLTGVGGGTVVLEGMPQVLTEEASFSCKPGACKTAL